MPWLASLGILVAVAAPVASGSAAAADPAIRKDLEVLATRTVYFGHQSVGGNVLDGLAALVADNGGGVRVVRADTAGRLEPGTLGHALVAENGNPRQKLASFARALAGGPDPDLALVKFCYVDFDAGTDARALFESYQAAIADLRGRHPGTVFVHVTAPLTTVQGGVKGALKRLIGSAPTGLRENARREQYNQLLRGAYQGREPLFDLAAAESTRPDGAREQISWKGEQVPALVADYAADEGHLNAEGRLRAARALLATLAAAPIRRAPPAAPSH